MRALFLLTVVEQFGGEGGALGIGFFVILGMIALAVLLGFAITLFRNLPLWIFSAWPHCIGIGLGVYLYFTGYGWIAAAAIAAAGIAFGMVWTGVIDRQTRRRKGMIGKIHSRLLRHATK